MTLDGCEWLDTYGVSSVDALDASDALDSLDSLDLSDQGSQGYLRKSGLRLST